MELNKNTLKLLVIISVIFYILSLGMSIFKYIIIIIIILYFVAYRGTKDYNKELFNCTKNYDLCEEEPLEKQNILNIFICIDNIKKKIKDDTQDNTMLLVRNYVRFFFDNIRQLNLEKIKNIFNNIEFSTSYVPQLYKTINCN